jgi:hypothetical protein
LEYRLDERNGVRSPLNDVRAKATQPVSSGWLDRHRRAISSRSHPGRIYVDNDDQNENGNQNEIGVESDANNESVISSSRTVVRRFSFHNEAERYFYNPTTYRNADAAGRRVTVDST